MTNKQSLHQLKDQLISNLDRVESIASEDKGKDFSAIRIHKFFAPEGDFSNFEKSFKLQPPRL